MPALDDAVLAAEKLEPSERLQLIKRLWRSIPVDYWPPQSDMQVADVRRRLAKLGVEPAESVPWPIVERLLSDCARSSGNQVFAAPRRFDLSTIFVITIAFSLLFASMRLLPFPPVVSAIVGGYFALIGLGQAFLFRGNRPRTASMLMGGTYYVLVSYVLWQLSGPRAYATSDILVIAIFHLIFGAVLGFVAGTLVGSVFMLADWLRTTARQTANHITQTSHVEGDPAACNKAELQTCAEAPPIGGSQR
jgi:putative addiction module component (TIGR02574 family)